MTTSWDGVGSTRRRVDDAGARRSHRRRAIDRTVAEVRAVRHELERRWLDLDGQIVSLVAVEALGEGRDRAPDAEAVASARVRLGEALDHVQAALAALDDYHELLSQDGARVSVEHSTAEDITRFPVEAPAELMADLRAKADEISTDHLAAYAMSNGIKPPAPGVGWSIAVVFPPGTDDFTLYWSSPHETEKGRIG